MNTQEARSVLAGIVAEHKNRSYAEWVSRIDDEPITFEISTTTDRQYQVEIQAFWDDKRRGNVRVMFAIDDGSWRTSCPLTESFIVAKDGSFVGE